jgi:hypothetical protein
MMAYLLDRVHDIIKSQYEANAEATRHGDVQTWDQYRHLVGWLAGAEYVLEAVAEAERKSGL